MNSNSLNQQQQLMQLQLGVGTSSVQIQDPQININNQGVLLHQFAGHSIQNAENINNANFEAGMDTQAYFSPTHLVQSQRLRTDSLGHYHNRIQAHFAAYTNQNQGNPSTQMIFGDQPSIFPFANVPNTQNLHQQVDQATVQSAVSSSHPPSSLQLQNMEPFFSAQHISQKSVASVIHSNLPSHKGSFHTDDSLTASPQQQPICPPQFHGSTPQISHMESVRSIFSRQSNYQRSGYGNIATTSMQCNETTVFTGRHFVANKDHSHIQSVSHGPGQANSTHQNPDEPEREDDIDFSDPALELIKLPSLHINLHLLSVTIQQNLRLSVQEEEKDENDLRGIIAITSIFETDDISNTPQQIEIQQPLLRQGTAPKTSNANQINHNVNQEEPFLTQSNSAYLLTASINSTNLGNSNNSGTSQSFGGGGSGQISQSNSQPVQQQTLAQQQQEQYQTLSLEQTIWSPQVPAQSHQEFLITQNQIVQQQQQQAQYHQSQSLPLEQHNNVVQPHPHSNTHIHSRGSDLNTAAPAFVHSSHASSIGGNAAAGGGIQPPTMPNQQNPFTQAFEMHQPTSSHQLNTHQDPQIAYQQYLSQGNFQGVNKDNLNSSTAHIAQETSPPTLTDVQKMTLNQMLNHQQLINQQIAHQYQNGSQQMMQHHLASIQQQQQQQNSNSQNLSSQEIQNAAQVTVAQAEALQHHLLVSAGQNQAVIPQQQQIMQQIQQQQQQQLIQNQQTNLIQAVGSQPGFNQKSLLPQQLIESQQALDQLPQSQNDFLNRNHYDHNTHLAQHYLNRQINRYILNPYYKQKSHKYAGQNSFRENAQSPDLLFPGNLSVFRPPPGFEHIVPKNLSIPLQNQILMSAAELAMQQQQQQQAAANQVVQQFQQQIIQQQQHQQQQQHLQPQLHQYLNSNHQSNQNSNNNSQGNSLYLNSRFAPLPRTEVYTSFFGEQIMNKDRELSQQFLKTYDTLLEDIEFQEQLTVGQDGGLHEEESNNVQQQQQLMQMGAAQGNNVSMTMHQVVDSQNQTHMSIHSGPNNLHVSSNILLSQIPSYLQQQQQQTQQAQSLMGAAGDAGNDGPFPGGQNASLCLMPSTQPLSFDVGLGSSSSSSTSKEDDKSRFEGVVKQQRIESSSTPRTESDNQMLFEDGAQKLKNGGTASNGQSYSKESKYELFKKIRNNLNKIKNEFLQTSDTQKQQPFRFDPTKYLEKILNLITIINEVESSTNKAELKSEYERTKQQLEKMRMERQKLFQELSQVTLQYHEIENNYQKLQTEVKQQREQQLKEREQLDMLLKMSNEQLRQHAEAKESLQQKVNELLIQLEHESRKKNESPSFSAQGAGKGSAKELERVKQIKQEYGRKLTDQQVEINDLREYIKKRSQEDQQKRKEDKKQQDIEIQQLKSTIETLKQQNEQSLKERDNEIRMLQEGILSYDPDYFKASSGQSKERVRECPDCKKKSSKIVDLEGRVKDLTEYIKKKGDRMGKLEEEIAKLKVQLAEALVQQQTIPEATIEAPKSQLINCDCLESQVKEVLAPHSQKFKDLTGLFVKLSILLEKIGQQSKECYPEECRTLVNDLLGQQSQIIHTDHSISACITDIAMFFKRQLCQKDQSSIQGFENLKQISVQEKEQQLLQKMGFGQEITDNYKEIVKEGRNERKLCHQVIVEVEKLMYKMNSLIITEQMNLEEDLKSVEPASINLVNQHQKSLATIERLLQSRQEMNVKLRELFGKILETYLELPHKLKPIFDRQKKNELTIGKYYKADPTLLYDLTAEIVEQYKNKGQSLTEQVKTLEERYIESKQFLSKVLEENESQKAKIISLNEKIVQVNSAYNALQKHLYHSGKPLSHSSSLSSISNTNGGQPTALLPTQQQVVQQTLCLESPTKPSQITNQGENHYQGGQNREQSIRKLSVEYNSSNQAMETPKVALNSSDIAKGSQQYQQS